jgi:hypothetical protein
MQQKLDKQALGAGAMSGMLDSMEFLRQAWGNFKLPSNLAPTIDPAEIDRRIADLKVVEQWLSVNLGMLRSAIQGMEVQRETLSALHSLGQAMTQPGAGGDAATRALEAFSQMQRAASAAPASPDEQTASPASTTGAQPGSKPTSPPPQAGPAGSAGRQAGGLADELSRAAVAAVNPNAWWQLLQSQFNQLAQAALGAGAAAAPANRPAPAPAPAPSSAPVADKPGGTARARPRASARQANAKRDSR